ncbi:MAG: MFS transporter [Burkholderiales bacterium]|nr:MFS transporter [Burkholderiales bacterium]MDP2396840.1 MFS transporter [Burkholderiales bacterium]
MTPLELRASIGLSGIFGLRMLGMFVILPVFAIYAESLPGGDDLTLVGIAIGIYGLTQAILQIPFGWWSDRIGRKPVVYAGLVIFAIGSFVAALAPNIYIVILGRVLQGAGAISAAVIAMTADLTRESQRAKAMAMIGSTIGASFALSLIASPWLDRVIGVPGIFAMTGILALAGIIVMWRVIPDAPQVPPAPGRALKDFWSVLTDPQLARLNWGIFALHAVLMALFIVVPFSLRDAGLPIAEHWKVYLPVMVGSFVLMLPPVMQAGNPVLLRRWFIIAVGLLLAGHLALPWLAANILFLSMFLLLFFVPFNVLEAMLPTLTTRLAPAHAKGTAIGLYSTIQFFGTFVGAAAGGFIYKYWGLSGVVVLDAGLLAIWLILALGMRVPPVVTRA